jgi:diacylglycerol kinase (ATP)
MESPFKGKSGLGRLVDATRYSLAGMAAALRHEPAFRLETSLAAVLVPLAKALLVGSVLLVLIVELVNSAVEAVVDRVSQERHELAGRAKDIGSAAVMLSLINAGAVWLLVLWP